MYYVLFVFAMLTPVLMMVFLCISAFLVDALLKNTFDENGLPIER